MWRLVFLLLLSFGVWTLWQTRLPQPSVTAETISTNGKISSAPVASSPEISLISQTDIPEPPWNGQLPILMYHYIRSYTDQSDPIGTNLSVAPDIFAEQLRVIRSMGFTPVSLDYLINPDPTIPRPLVITFDDGYADAYSAAFQALQAYGMTATFYLVTNFIDQEGYLTWGEIETMRQAGMSFGGHTANHRDLTKLTEPQLTDELRSSKQLLEEHLGRPVVDFCYPSGRLNEIVVAAVQAAGYQTATTTVSGIATTESQPLQLPRIRMTNTTDLAAILTEVTQTSR